MFQRHGRDSSRAQATAEHRRREDAAPRLREQAPRLLSLRLSLEEKRQDSSSSTRTYVRPIVVSTAPAYFELRCTEPKCDGRHDITQEILEGIVQGREVITGESPCNGMDNNQLCDCTLTYLCQATYTP